MPQILEVLNNTLFQPKNQTTFDLSFIMAHINDTISNSALTEFFAVKSVDHQNEKNQLQKQLNDNDQRLVEIATRNKEILHKAHSQCHITETIEMKQLSLSFCH